MRTAALPLLKLLVSIALVALLLRNADAAQVLERLAALPPGALAACLGLMLAHTLLCAWRWRQVCIALGFGAPAPRNALRWSALSVLLSQALPSSVGGDAYRIAALGKRTRYADAARSVIHDRVNGLWVLALIAAAGLTVILWSGSASRELLAACLVMAGFVLIFPAATRTARRWPDAAAAHRLLGSPLIVSTSIAIHAMTVAAVVVLALGTAQGQWWPMALLAPFAMLAAAVPISVAGWGVREAAFVVGAQSLGVPAADALAVSLAYGVMLIATGALGALAWAALPEHRSAGAPT
jgi:glycosyltransferase 2 family protein